MTTINETPVRLIASSQSWIENEAIRQLHATAALEGVRSAVGFPDLHPGRAGPVGAAFVTEGVIYPCLVGGDIGCGMALFKTDLLRRKARLDHWSERSFDLEYPWEGDARKRLAGEGLVATQFVEAFGTLGGGNHFAELQAVEKVLDRAAFEALGLGKDNLVLLVHCGSRGLGQAVLETHLEEHGASGLEAPSHAATRYLLCHDHAVRWAGANRTLLAQRFLDTLGAGGLRVLDACHNSITPVASPSPHAPRSLRREPNQLKRGGDQIRLTPDATVHGHEARAAARVEAPHKGESPGMNRGAGFEAGSAQRPRWLHRKGAAPADRGPLVIPGSRGTLSYLVQPCGDGVSHAWSLAHGAGRKWTRSESRARVRERFRPAQLTQTGLGGRVVCGDRSLLYEEAPPAYKSIEQVIADLVDASLVTVIATLRPLLTYKTRAMRP